MRDAVRVSFYQSSCLAVSMSSHSQPRVQNTHSQGQGHTSSCGYNDTARDSTDHAHLPEHQFSCVGVVAVRKFMFVGQRQRDFSLGQLTSQRIIILRNILTCNHTAITIIHHTCHTILSPSATFSPVRYSNHSHHTCHSSMLMRPQSWPADF